MSFPSKKEEDLVKESRATHEEKLSAVGCGRMWKANKKEREREKKRKPKKRNVKVEKDVEGERRTVEVNSEGTCLDGGCLAKNSRSSVPFVTWRVLGNSLDLSLCVLASPPVVPVVTLPPSDECGLGGCFFV